MNKDIRIKKNSDGSYYYFWKSHFTKGKSKFYLIDKDKLPFDLDTIEIKEDDKYEWERFLALEKYCKVNGTSLGEVEDICDHSGFSHIFIKYSKNHKILEVRLCRLITTELNNDEEYEFDYDNPYEFETAYLNANLNHLETEKISSLKNVSGEFVIFNPYEEYMEAVQYNINNHSRQIGQEILNEGIKDDKIYPFSDPKQFSIQSFFPGFKLKLDKGIFDIYSVSAVSGESLKKIYKDEEVQVQFPCCSSLKEFRKDFLLKKWGVQYLVCNDCNKNHTNIENYISTKDGKKINFLSHGINGYKDEIIKGDRCAYSTVIKLSDQNNRMTDFKYMYE